MSLQAVFQGKRVLVTGHTGFKGSWLSVWLAKLGAKVQGYALAPQTEPALFTLASLPDLVRHEVGDVRDLDHLSAIVSSFQPEVVFHLAAQPIVRRSYLAPKETFDVNVGGTVNVLEAIRMCPSIRAAVLITSDKCYENREWIWGYRENDPMGGHDPYSASKGAAELVIAAYIRSFFSQGLVNRQVGVASARAGNVIGGGDFSEDRILPDAIRAVQANQPLDVRSPTAHRPWQHVLDPLAGYLALAARLLEEPHAFQGGWNFGPVGQDSVSVSELVTLFLRELGTGSWNDVSLASNKLHEAKILRLSCEKVLRELNWKPVWNTDEAIRNTAIWYRDVCLLNENARTCLEKDLQAFLNLASQKQYWWAL